MVTGISFDARDEPHAVLISRAHGWNLIGEVLGIDDEEVMALIQSSQQKTLH